MNAVEIEEAISQLADQPFDAGNFPYAFLEAFDNKETTIRRLRAGASNKSDLGGVLQTNNIHIAACETGQVTKTLQGNNRHQTKTSTSCVVTVVLMPSSARTARHSRIASAMLVSASASDTP